MVLIKSLFRKKKRSEEGQGTVEFALILPILFLIIFGIIDFGWLFFNMELVSNTARSSARHAVVSVHDYAEKDAHGDPKIDGATNDVAFKVTTGAIFIALILNVLLMLPLNCPIPVIFTVAV